METKKSKHIARPSTRDKRVAFPVISIIKMPILGIRTRTKPFDQTTSQAINFKGAVINNQ